MASTFSKSFALFLSLNILFFTLVSSCGECESHGPKPKPRPRPGPRPRPSPGSGSKGGGSYPGSGGTPIIGGGIPVVGGGIPVVGGGIPVVGGGIPVVGGGIPVVGGGVPVVGGGIPVVGGGVPVIGGGIPIIGGGSPVVGGGSPSTGGGSSSGSCPIDALKLGVCANVLNTLLNVTLGTPPVTPCCPLIQGLVDLEAAVCLCTAIRANILGINLNIPISLSLLINHCGGRVPRGFQCP